MISKIFLLAFLFQFTSSQFLSVGGRDFFFNGQRIHLSGVNIAWRSYGFDFGNGQYSSNGPELEQWIREIADAGGNSLRIWIHVEGDNTPEFDWNGFVTAPDRYGTLINDLNRFLDIARDNNVFVIPVLWNGALMRNQRYLDLTWDDAKLDSYINNALIPMVNALRGRHALGAWEIMNEPEGSVRIEGDGNPCFNTNNLASNGAGWSGANVPMFRLLRFLNRQAAAIKRANPKALITIGAWSELSTTDAFHNSFNYYKNTCLQQAGGESLGTVDFYQIHTYSWEGNWSAGTPFRNHANAYQLDKPIVIGEFSASCAQNEGVDALWLHSYNNGYAGTWSWQYNAGGHCSDTAAQQRQGMNRIRNYGHNGVIRVHIP